jgi:hypothetical protein
MQLDSQTQATADVCGTAATAWLRKRMQRSRRLCWSPIAKYRRRGNQPVAITRCSGVSRPSEHTFV